MTQASSLDPQLADAYKAQAWLLATCPDPNVRNGMKAVEAVRHAIRLKSIKSARDIEILTAAYAEASDFARAIQGQKVMNEMVLSSDDKKAGEARLKLYESGKPYREFP